MPIDEVSTIYADYAVRTGTVTSDDWLESECVITGGIGKSKKSR